MEPATAAALERINRAFYERRANEFSATRERPWPAWERVADLAERTAAGRPPRVLDLGCGNGRLGRFLAGRWGDRLEYLGVDASEPMLEIARGSGGPGEYLRRDLLAAERFEALPAERFEVITAFGLLHHLPGFVRRAALLRDAAGRLAPGGLLAASFWQFGALERFRRRIVPWELYNRSAAEPIATDELEPGDLLLAWGELPAPGDGMPPVRYCHWARPEEVDRLLSGLHLDSVAAFRSDGLGRDLNLYRILQA